MGNKRYGLSVKMKKSMKVMKYKLILLRRVIDVENVIILDVVLKIHLDTIILIKY